MAMLARHKPVAQWQRQMARRGWTMEEIDEAIAAGARHAAVNHINPGNTAPRYVSPRNGRPVVVDDQTGEVLHVGASGYRY